MSKLINLARGKIAAQLRGVAAQLCNKLPGCTETAASNVTEAAILYAIANDLDAAMLELFREAISESKGFVLPTGKEK